jgi:hypothetical protein
LSFFDENTKIVNWFRIHNSYQAENPRAQGECFFLISNLLKTKLIKKRTKNQRKIAVKKLNLVSETQKTNEKQVYIDRSGSAGASCG